MSKLHTICTESGEDYERAVKAMEMGDGCLVLVATLHDGQMFETSTYVPNSFVHQETGVDGPITQVKSRSSK